MTTTELIERGIGHNCLSDAYDLGRHDAETELNTLGECEYNKGAEDFAKWLQENVFISGVTVICGEEFARVNGFLELYAKWQKGKK